MAANPGRMRTLACRTILIAVAASPLSFAWAAVPCTKSDEQAAEDRVGRLTSWHGVYDAYKRFAHCDDGSIGQGFSESITLLLASRWNRVEQLRRLIAKDQGFEAFVLTHVDPTVPVERRNNIVANANEHCPKKSAALCQKLARRAADR